MSEIWQLRGSTRSCCWTKRIKSFFEPRPTEPRRPLLQLGEPRCGKRGITVQRPLTNQRISFQPHLQNNPVIISHES
ncbi:hypothetical protein Y032_0575g193 [Ancylostoma ceylanicum]|uniref:Uncharacterized protein n=1 Tax=Ancylostoma ceylanicum TaxID=53326 RepID=A0A016WN57_9BILA|nr:hypothetical protein Y032_0575g193 [Ancylostoma ceylanicum]